MKKFRLLIVFLFFFFFSLTSIKAASGTYSGGGANLYIDRSTDIVISLYTDGDIMAYGGTVTSTDSSCVRVNYVSGLGGTSVNGTKFAFVDTGGNVVGSGKQIAVVNITGLRACSASLTISGAEVTSNELGDIAAGVDMGYINVSEPPSSNNNLSGLSVSVGGLNPGFDPGTTYYSVNVDSNVSSIEIGASAQDGGARIEGAGTRYLNYGSNEIGIRVVAPSGDAKTYVINVNRRDDRSGNNNLASLSISNGSLNGGFDPNNLYYSGTVPYEVETAEINAVAADGKSSVYISGNRGLISEETSNVTITVTAENGATKTYNIAITRGKDPNKVLATDNYLNSITPSIGILSPVFDREKLNYVIYLPYEVEKISFTTTISDTRYGILNVEGPETLAAGISNIFKFNVTAEDESVRTYTVVVKRAVNPDATSSSNTYLKSITLNNGTLLFTNGKKVTDFNKEIKKYYYQKGNAFSYEVETEDPNAAVTTVSDGSSIQFIVEAPNGEFSIYTLDLYGRYNNIIRYIVVFVVGVAAGIGALKVLGMTSLLAPKVPVTKFPDYKIPDIREPEPKYKDKKKK